MTVTRIAASTPTDILVRGKSLPHELMGQLDLTQMICFQILGRVPPPPVIVVLDACLIALMEHGLTPSAIVSRLVYSSAPEAMQGAVAAGLLGVGGRFVGTAEGAAALFERIVKGEDPAAIVSEHRAARRAIPGFGHDTHTPDDPRTPRLFAIARAQGIAGAHVDAAVALSAALDRTLGKHVTINATGAVAAVLLDAGFPAALMRGFALIARCAGLVGHIFEEQQDPAFTTLWDAAASAVPYQKSEENQ